MMTSGRFCCVLLFAMATTSCAAHKLYKQGQELAEAGSEYKAAGKYLAALEKREGYGKAQEALVAIAADAYEEKRQSAAALEGSGDFPGALKEYQALEKFLERLDAVAAKDFQTINVGAKVAEMKNSAAEGEYVAAERDFAARSWGDAIAHYQAAQGFKEGYKDSVAKVAAAFAGWGDDDLGQKAFRKAAEHYASAAALGSVAPPRASANGGAIYAALGHHFLGADRCRQAVRDLRLAEGLLGPDKVATDLNAATSCAVTPVAILPFENPTGVSVAGLALGDALADQIGSKVSKDGSEFVRLLERTALDQILKENGISTNGLNDGKTSGLTGVRYLVIGKLTQVHLEAPGPATTARTAPGKAPYKCTKTTSSGKSYESTCYNDVVVSYREHSARESLTVAGSVRVVDVKTGEQLASPAIKAVSDDSTTWADAFYVGATPVAVGSEGVQVDSDIVKLASGKQTLLDESALATSVLDRLSTDAAKAVLAVADIEKPATDPSTLTISGLVK